MGDEEVAVHPCKYEGRWEDIQRLLSEQRQSHDDFLLLRADVKTYCRKVDGALTTLQEISERQSRTDGYLRGKSEGITQLATTEQAILSTSPRPSHGFNSTQLIMLIAMGATVVGNILSIIFNHLQASIPSAVSLLHK